MGSRSGRAVASIRLPKRAGLPSEHDADRHVHHRSRRCFSGRTNDLTNQRRRGVSARGEPDNYPPGYAGERNGTANIRAGDCDAHSDVHAHFRRYAREHKRASSHRAPGPARSYGHGRDHANVGGHTHSLTDPPLGSGNANPDADYRLPGSDADGGGHTVAHASAQLYRHGDRDAAHGHANSYARNTHLDAYSNADSGSRLG